MPTPPRNPALDPFRHRTWSESALNPPARRTRRPHAPAGKVFVINRDSRRFAVVAANLAAAESRITALS